MSTPNWKKVVDYLQFYILTVIATVAISLILNFFFHTIKWEKMTDHLIQYCKVVTIIYLEIIFLREARGFRGKSGEDFIGLYIVSIILGIICAILNKAPEEIFGNDEVQYFLFRYSQWIIGGIALILGAIHPKFGFAMSLSFLGVTVLFLYPFSNQLYILGALTGCATAGFFLRKIIFTRWSELIPSKKPGVEILK